MKSVTPLAPRQLLKRFGEFSRKLDARDGSARAEQGWTGTVGRQLEKRRITGESFPPV